MDFKILGSMMHGEDFKIRAIGCDVIEESDDVDEYIKISSFFFFSFLDRSNRSMRHDSLEIYFSADILDSCLPMLFVYHLSHTRMIKVIGLHQISAQ